MTVGHNTVWERPDWYDHARCRHVEIERDWFFPGPGRTLDAAKAKKVCAGCVVRRACLLEALTISFCAGIWGGMNPRERFKFKRENPREKWQSVALPKVATHRADAPPACPICALPVPVGNIGNPKTYCSVECRQTAQRRRYHEKKRAG